MTDNLRLADLEVRLTGNMVELDQMLDGAVAKYREKAQVLGNSVAEALNGTLLKMGPKLISAIDRINTEVAGTRLGQELANEMAEGVRKGAQSVRTQINRLFEEIDLRGLKEFRKALSEDMSTNAASIRQVTEAMKQLEARSDTIRKLGKKGDELTYANKRIEQSYKDLTTQLERLTKESEAFRNSGLFGDAQEKGIQRYKQALTELRREGIKGTAAELRALEKQLESLGGSRANLIKVKAPKGVVQEVEALMDGIRAKIRMAQTETEKLARQETAAANARNQMELGYLQRKRRQQEADANAMNQKEVQYLNQRQAQTIRDKNGVNQLEVQYQRKKQAQELADRNAVNAAEVRYLNQQAQQRIADRNKANQLEVKYQQDQQRRLIDDRNKANDLEVRYQNDKRRQELADRNRMNDLEVRYQRDRQREATNQSRIQARVGFERQLFETTREVSGKWFENFRPEAKIGMLNEVRDRLVAWRQAFADNTKEALRLDQAINSIRDRIFHTTSQQTKATDRTAQQDREAMNAAEVRYQQGEQRRRLAERNKANDLEVQYVRRRTQQEQTDRNAMNQLEVTYQRKQAQQREADRNAANAMEVRYLNQRQRIQDTDRNRANEMEVRYLRQREREREAHLNTMNRLEVNYLNQRQRSQEQAAQTEERLQRAAVSALDRQRTAAAAQTRQVQLTNTLNSIVGGARSAAADTSRPLRSLADPALAAGLGSLAAHHTRGAGPGRIDMLEQAKNDLRTMGRDATRTQQEILQINKALQQVELMLTRLKNQDAMEKQARASKALHDWLTQTRDAMAQLNARKLDLAGADIMKQVEALKEYKAQLQNLSKTSGLGNRQKMGIEKEIETLTVRIQGLIKNGFRELLKAEGDWLKGEMAMGVSFERQQQLAAEYQRRIDTLTASFGRLTKAQQEQVNAARRLPEQQMHAEAVRNRGDYISAAMGFGMMAAPTMAMEAVTTQKFGEFSQAMANVNSIAKVSAGELERMASQVERISADPRIAAAPTKLAQGLYQIVSSGHEGAQAMTDLHWAAKGATAGQAELDVTSKVLVSTMTAFKEHGYTAQQVMDLLFKTVDKGIVTFPEMTQHMGQVNQTAETLGVSLEEVGASIAIFTRRGLMPAEAFTALNNLMMGMAKPQQDAVDEARRLGIEWFEMGKAAEHIKKVGLVSALQEIADATKGNIAQIQLLLPGIREFRGAAAAIADGGKDLKAMTVEFGSAIGATDQALARQSEGFQIKVAKMQAAWDRFLISLGKNNALLKGVDGVTALIDAMNKMPDGMKAGITVGGGVVGAASMAAGGMATLGFALQSMQGLTAISPKLAQFGISLAKMVPQLALVTAGVGALALAYDQLWPTEAKAIEEAERLNDIDRQRQDQIYGQISGLQKEQNAYIELSDRVDAHKARIANIKSETDRKVESDRVQKSLLEELRALNPQVAAGLDQNALSLDAIGRAAAAAGSELGGFIAQLSRVGSIQIHAGEMITEVIDKARDTAQRTAVARQAIGLINLAKNKGGKITVPLETLQSWVATDAKGNVIGSVQEELEKRGVKLGSAPGVSALIDVTGTDFDPTQGRIEQRGLTTSNYRAKAAIPEARRLGIKDKIVRAGGTVPVDVAFSKQSIGQTVKDLNNWFTTEMAAEVARAKQAKDPAHIAQLREKLESRFRSTAAKEHTTVAEMEKDPRSDLAKTMASLRNKIALPTVTEPKGGGGGRKRAASHLGERDYLSMMRSIMNDIQASDLPFEEQASLMEALFFQVRNRMPLTSPFTGETVPFDMRKGVHSNALSDVAKAEHGFYGKQAQELMSRAKEGVGIRNENFFAKHGRDMSAAQQEQAFEEALTALTADQPFNQRAMAGRQGRNLLANERRSLASARLKEQTALIKQSQQDILQLQEEGLEDRFELANRELSRRLKLNKEQYDRELDGAQGNEEAIAAVKERYREADLAAWSVYLKTGEDLLEESQQTRLTTIAQMQQQIAEFTGRSGDKMAAIDSRAAADRAAFEMGIRKQVDAGLLSQTDADTALKNYRRYSGMNAGRQKQAVSGDFGDGAMSLLDDMRVQGDAAKDHLVQIAGTIQATFSDVWQAVTQENASAWDKMVAAAGSSSATIGGYLAQRVLKTMTSGDGGDVLSLMMGTGGAGGGLANDAVFEMAKEGAVASGMAAGTGAGGAAQLLGALGPFLAAAAPFLALAAGIGAIGVTTGAIINDEVTYQGFGNTNRRKRYDEAKKNVQDDYDIVRAGGVDAYLTTNKPFWGGHLDRLSTVDRSMFGLVQQAARSAGVTGNEVAAYEKALGDITERLTHWATQVENTEAGGREHAEAQQGLSAAMGVYAEVMRKLAAARLGEAMTIAVAGGGITGVEGAQVQTLRDVRKDIVKRIRKAEVNWDLAEIELGYQSLEANITEENRITTLAEARGRNSKRMLGLTMERAGLLDAKGSAQLEIDYATSERDALKNAIEKAMVEGTDVFFNGLRMPLKEAERSLVSFERQVRRLTDTMYATSPEGRRDRAVAYAEGMQSNNTMTDAQRAVYQRDALIAEAAYQIETASNPNKTKQEQDAAMKSAVASLKQVRDSVFDQVQRQFAETRDAAQAEADAQIKAVQAEMNRTVAGGGKITAAQVKRMADAQRQGQIAQAVYLKQEMSRMDISDEYRRKLEADFQSLKTQYIYAEDQLRKEKAKEWIEEMVKGLERERQTLATAVATSQSSEDQLVAADYGPNGFVVRQAALGQALIDKGTAEGNVEIADRGRQLLAEAAGKYAQHKAQFFGTMKFAANQELRELMASVSVDINELNSILTTESQLVLEERWTNATGSAKTYAGEVKRIGDGLVAVGNMTKPVADALTQLFTNPQAAMGSFLTGLVTTVNALRAAATAAANAGQRYSQSTYTPLGIGNLIGGVGIVKTDSAYGNTGAPSVWLNPTTGQPMYHSGGVVSRFHTGRSPWLRTGEVEAILMEGEEVKTERDPWHIANLEATTLMMATRIGAMLNGGSAGGRPTIVLQGNYFDKDVDPEAWADRFADRLTLKGLV